MRCTSTGRTCDGYLEPLIPSSKGQLVAPIIASSSSSQGQLKSAPRIWRQISPDIQGTETERFYFHCFRAEALRGFALHAVNRGLFWECLMPRVAHHNDAVRHALIALGAAYHLEVHHDSSSSEVDHHRLEIFTIRQYNKAMHSLTKHLVSASQEHVEITLLCALIFTFIESIRHNREHAVLHLDNGLRIIEQLPTPFLQHILADTVSDPADYERRISKSELQRLLGFFQDLELGTQVLGAPSKPTLSLCIYEVTKEYDGPWEE